MCGSPLQIHHAALDTLSIAHVDCDALYATVEKRDQPDLADRPVIIGGGALGSVVASAAMRRGSMARARRGLTGTDTPPLATTLRRRETR